jgi:predicted DNA binding CopG/RHH family protein
MEKLEKHIKEKLEERKISPSAAAWESVEASLEPEKKRKGTYWYAIAASVIGLLIVSIIFFNSQDKGVPSPEIVDVEKESRVNEIEKVNNPVVVETISSEEKINLLQQEKDLSKVKKHSFKENVVEQNTAIVRAEVTPEKREFIQDSFVPTKSQDFMINQKVNEVLATVINLESEAIQVTDAEVDSLLRQAQNEILKEKIFDNIGKVDAMALLTEVEDELDQSFRDKIFTKLKEGLFKARTAVADRNN